MTLLWLTSLAAAAASPSIKDLSWMIGDWTFHDVATAAAGFDYEEKGSRSCRWALRNQYIRCESEGGTALRPRAYVSYLNYNPAAERFEMVSMWSNHPPKSVQFGTISNDGKEVRWRSLPQPDDDGVIKVSWSIIRFDGQSTWTWESGSKLEGAANDGPVRFRDTIVRKPMP